MTWTPEDRERARATARDVAIAVHGRDDEHLVAMWLADLERLAGWELSTGPHPVGCRCTDCAGGGTFGRILGRGVPRPIEGDPVAQARRRQAEAREARAAGLRAPRAPRRTDPGRTDGSAAAVVTTTRA